MPEALLYPLDRIHPDQLLNQYSDWIYFTLLLVFFISLAGITLRKQFDRPYVKPLIITVGIMLTIGVFMYKERLVQIFEGWGIVGLILLVILVATIPFNLCRGYGMPAKKAFYLTYILFYIVAWVSFPNFFYSLAARNLGLVNLGLLVVFVAAVIKMVPLRKDIKFADRWKKESAFNSDIQKNIQVENKEKGLVKSRLGKVLKTEVRTIQDMAEALAQIQRIVESQHNNFSNEERLKVADYLKKISNSENLFKESFMNFQKTSEQIDLMDEKQLSDLKRRAETVNDKEKQIIMAEIEREEQKLKTQNSFRTIGEKLTKSIQSFNQSVSYAVENLKGPQFYYAAKEGLAKARLTLQEIFEMLQRVQDLEKRLLHLSNAEKGLLKKEKQIA
jgi:hypothetical protein